MLGTTKEKKKKNYSRTISIEILKIMKKLKIKLKLCFSEDIMKGLIEFPLINNNNYKYFV